jgi:hypothetical protein
MATELDRASDVVEVEAVVGVGAVEAQEAAAGRLMPRDSLPVDTGGGVHGTFGGGVVDLTARAQQYLPWTCAGCSLENKSFPSICEGCGGENAVYSAALKAGGGGSGGEGEGNAEGVSPPMPPAATVKETVFARFPPSHSFSSHFTAVHSAYLVLEGAYEVSHSSCCTPISVPPLAPPPPPPRSLSLLSSLTPPYTYNTPSL